MASEQIIRLPKDEPIIVSVLTPVLNHPEISELFYHHHWEIYFDSLELDYTFGITSNDIFENTIEAIFKPKKEISFESNLNNPNAITSIEVQDPWALDGEWNQNNQFVQLDTTHYLFFREEGQQINLMISPYYNIRAPQFTLFMNEENVFDYSTFYQWVVKDEDNSELNANYHFTNPLNHTTPVMIQEYASTIVADYTTQSINVNDGVYLELQDSLLFANAPQVKVENNQFLLFDHWTGSNGIQFQNSSSHTTELSVSGPSNFIEANYICASCDGVPITIPSNTTLKINEGQYELHPDFRIDVEGNIDINGLLDSRVEFFPSGDNGSWGGINVYPVSGDKTINISYVIMKGAGIFIEGDYPIEINIDHSLFYQSSNPIRIDLNSTEIDQRLTANLINNTIFSPTVGGVEVLAGSTGEARATLLFENNIIQQAEFEIMPLSENVEIILRNNCFYNIQNEFQFDAFNGSDNMSENPLLNEYYYLTPNSPCIDVGNINTPNDPDGTIADIGAFYYQLPTVSVSFDSTIEIGDSPTLVWEAPNVENSTLSYDVYTFNEFDLTPVLWTSATTTSIIDQHYVITSFEDPDNLRIWKKGDVQAEHDDFQKFYYIVVKDENNHKSGSSNELYAWVQSARPIWKLVSENIPNDYQLNNAYPNPFNPAVTIPFGLPTESNVTISIYNLVGREVRAFQSEQLKAGFHSVKWNSLTDSGQKVPSGMYIVRMNAISIYGNKSFTQSQKIVLLK